MEGQDENCETSTDAKACNSPIVLSSDEDLDTALNLTIIKPFENQVKANNDGAKKLRELLCADRSHSQETNTDSLDDKEEPVLPLCSYTHTAVSQAVKNHQTGRSLKNGGFVSHTRFHPVNANNGKLKFAFDTKLSLLQLAHKLRQTRERVAKKRYLSPRATRIKDLLTKKKSAKPHETIPSKQFVSTKNTPHEANFCKVPLSNIVTTQVTKPLPAQVMNASPSTASTMEISFSAKQSPIIVNSEPVPLPALPKQAIELLTSLKAMSHGGGMAIEETEDYVKNLPDCSHLPLWPLIGANKESAAKMEIPALNDYIQNIPVTVGSNTKGKSSKSGGSLKGGEKNKGGEDGNVPDMPQLPEPLCDTHLEAVQKAAVATVLSTNLPKNARRAYDITRLSFEACKRNVNLNILRAAAKANSASKGFSFGNVHVVAKQSNMSDVQVPSNSNKTVIETGSNKPTVGPGLQTKSPYTVSLLKGSSPNVVRIQGALNVSRPQGTKNPNSLLLSQQNVPVTVPSPAGKSNVVLLVKEVNSTFNSVELVTVNSPKQGPSNSNHKDDALTGKDEVKVEKVQTIKKEKETKQSSGNSAYQSIPRRYQCSQCNYQTDNRSHLRRHESSVHSGDKLYCCYVCKKEFARSEKCKSHIIKTHPEVGYDHRFIRKDKFQSRQVYQSLGKGQIKTESEMDSPPKVSPVLFTSTPIKEVSEISERLKMEEVAHRLADNIGDEVGEVSNCSNGTNLWERSRDQSNVSNASSQEDSGMDLSLNSSKVTLLDSPTRLFRCQICFYEGRDAWHLKRHISDVHNNKKAFRCRVCNYVTSRKHRLISHMKNHGELYCIHCEFSTTDYNNFSYHLKSCMMQQRAGNMACELCKHPCFNRKILSDHVQRVHKTELWCCELCTFTCTDEERFGSHEQEHFKVDCSATCNKCKVAFESEQMCGAHVLRFHKGEYDSAVFDRNEVDFDDVIYTCQICYFKTEHKPVMKNHVDMHERNRYLCEYPACPFSCTSKKTMRCHIKCEHTENNVEVVILRSLSPATVVKEDVEDEEMDTHMDQDIDTTMDSKGNQDNIIYDVNTGGLIGHGSGRWNCMICPDKPPFRYRRSYEKHMSKHVESPEQVDPIPVKNLSERSSASGKAVVHVYTCAVCPAGTIACSSSKDLQQHMQIVHQDKSPMETEPERSHIEENSNSSAVADHEQHDQEQNGLEEDDCDSNSVVLEQVKLPPREKDEAWTRRNSVQDWVNQQQAYVGATTPMEEDSEASGQDE